MSIVYDMPPIETDDPNVAKINKHNGRVIEATQLGVYWVEYLPWLQHVPSRFTGWKGKIERYHQVNTMYYELFSKVQNDTNQGIDRPSMSAKPDQTTEVFRPFGRGGRRTAGDMFKRSDVVARAQKELDAVVGRGRPPSFADLPHLPYTYAVVRELLRWRPPSHLGIPHVSVADDWYENVFIPRGTTVFSNVWQCNHDPELYGVDTAYFNPARFLDKEGGVWVRPAGMRGKACREQLAVHRHRDTALLKFEPRKDEQGREVPVNVNEYVGESLMQYMLSCVHRERASS
ncbi:cytochrome P450 [Gloeopeniophorella convolvens]|nr:cytochrome P450 [Gloeopeniophorella convolvens]